MIIIIIIVSVMEKWNINAFTNAPFSNFLPSHTSVMWSQWNGIESNLAFDRKSRMMEQKEKNQILRVWKIIFNKFIDKVWRMWWEYVRHICIRIEHNLHWIIFSFFSFSVEFEASMTSKNDKPKCAITSSVHMYIYEMESFLFNLQTIEMDLGTGISGFLSLFIEPIVNHTEGKNVFSFE